MNCNHVSKVLKWGVDANTNLVAELWGCSLCNWESSEPHIREDSISHGHTEYVEGCFSCKIKTLELGTGDANGALVANGWTNKKWDGELAAYRNARAEGIEPKSTKLKDIQAAVEVSDKTGQAFVAS
jgi:hypothetical protein